MKQYLESFFKGFKEFGLAFSTLANSLLLFVVYILGVGLTSLVARLFGKHFLNMKPSKKSYWEDYNLSNGTIEEYYRQF